MVPNDVDVLTKMQRVAAGYHIDLTFTPIHTAVSHTYDWRTVTTLPTPAAAILLNGRPIVYTHNVYAAQGVLSDVKQALLPRGLTKKNNSKYVGHISIVEQFTSVVNVLDELSAVRYILNPNSDELAARSESVTSLLGLQGPLLVSGTHGVVRKPLLQLATETTVTKTVSVPYNTKFVSDNHLGYGSVRVIEHGRSGLARETVQQRYVNGELVNQTVVIKDILQQPVSEVARRGTNDGIASGPWQWPTIVYDITSPFGARDLDGVNGFHPGVDIGCPVGTPIYATNNGIVEDAGWNDGGYGIWVRISNGNGEESIFGHLSSVAVQSGQMVGKGMLIGYSGETGFATGPHLHYEVRLNGTPVNPSPYM